MEPADQRQGMTRLFPPPLRPKVEVPPSSDARRNAPTTVKLEYLNPDDEHRLRDCPEERETESHNNDFIVKNEGNSKEEDADSDGEQEDEPNKGQAVKTARGKRLRLLPGPRTRRDSLRSEHRRRLDALLQGLVREHCWKEAAGVLCVLLRWAPSAYNVSDDDIRRYHTVAMELHRRSFGGNDRRYEMWIRQIYDTWMSRFSTSEADSRKKNGLMMEVALFYFTQGKVEEAYSMMQFVIQDRDLANDPCMNLLYGMILYQLWYSGLPDEYKIKSSNSSTPIGPFEFSFNDGCQRMEIGESSDDHCAAFSEDIKFSSQYASESSCGNDKVFMDRHNDRPKAEFRISPSRQEFCVSHSTGQNEQKAGLHNAEDNFRNSSIFFACGLDTCLLPIRLEHLTGHVDEIIYHYRSLADGYYADAVKHLKLALHSTRPVHAALLPLIQLLLLGDRVDEAFEELDASCRSMDTAQPFRLMARLLECFQSSKVTQICSYYEKSLEKDPTCHYSMERLVAMHKSGNLSTVRMFEMIALHLDAASGQCCIWEEFASCFLHFAQSDFGDCSSRNLQRGETTVLSSNRIPIGLMEEDTRASWKLRFLWWKRSHFSVSSLPQQAGDLKMLCFKAACAAHLYGRTYEYVVQVIRMLTQADSEQLPILKTHMHKVMELFEHL